MEVWFYNWARMSNVDEFFKKFGYSETVPTHIETRAELGNIIIDLTDQKFQVMVQKIPTGYMLYVDTNKFTRR